MDQSQWPKFENTKIRQCYPLVNIWFKVIEALVLQPLKFNIIGKYFQFFEVNRILWFLDMNEKTAFIVFNLWTFNCYFICFKLVNYEQCSESLSVCTANLYLDVKNYSQKIALCFKNKSSLKKIWIQIPVHI